jgi:hypothetical protein
VVAISVVIIFASKCTAPSVNKARDLPSTTIIAPAAKERRNSSRVFDIGDERALESACADVALEVGISAS